MLIRLILLAVIFTALAWSLLVALGSLPSPFARTLIRIQAGGARLVKGTLKPSAREHIVDLLGGAGIRTGFITVAADGRITFSPQIPSHLHQQLRNIILN